MPLKPHTTLREQVAKLEQRGLIFQDKAVQQASLERLGYYRLAGYLYPFREWAPDGSGTRLDTYIAGTSYDHVLSLYDFDKRLRAVVLDAVECLEIAVRTRVAHHLGRANPTVHEDGRGLDRSFLFAKKGQSGPSGFQVWRTKLDTTVQRSRADFVEHHRRSYGGRMPIWVAIELFDFGMTSTLFSGMSYGDQRAVAAQFGVNDGPVFGSWLRAISFIRNVAAHHARLWNVNVVNTLRLPKPAFAVFRHVEPTPREKLYSTLAVLQFLMRRTVGDSTWSEDVQRVVSRFPVHPDINLSNAGFPSDWRAQSLWTTNPVPDVTPA